MKAKLIVLAVLSALVVLFVAQNLAAVEIRFLFWSIEMSRALLVLIVLMVGAVIGWLATALARRARLERDLAE